MASTSRTGKTERLEARITLEQKEFFQHAADLSGRSLTDFVVSSVQEKAEEAVRSHQILELSARSAEEFIDALENPPVPNERLRNAVRRYRTLVEK